MAPKRTVVVGCKGQLGRALTALLPGSIGLDLPEFDLRDPAAIASVPWGQVGTIINAAAYTSVDAAETQAEYDAAVEHSPSRKLREMKLAVGLEEEVPDWVMRQLDARLGEAIAPFVITSES